MPIVVPSLLDHPSRAVTMAQRVTMGVLLTVAFGLFKLGDRLMPKPPTCPLEGCELCDPERSSP